MTFQPQFIEETTKSFKQQNATKFILMASAECQVATSTQDSVSKPSPSRDLTVIILAMT